MNKIVISLIALAAASTASFAAGNHSGDLRESPTYVGQYADQSGSNAPATFALSAANETSGPLSNAELIKRNQEKNASSSH
jgi:hypothetical protein